MTTPISKPFFRRVEEIDFLRALAIIGVVANHLLRLPGGFLGVDVFFVISGYVITLLMLKEVSEGTFQFSNFYHKRIARIIPPMLAVSLFIYLCAKLLFWIPDDYEFIRKSFGYQAFFSQNFYFAAQSADYFHGLTTAKLNLHFWSLAVEEQFYIVYPALFVLAYKFRGKLWMQIVIALALIASLVVRGSFFVAHVVPLLDKLLQINSEQDTLHRLRYYLLPTRIWEFLFGVMACVLSSKLHPLLQNRKINIPIVLLRGMSIASIAAIIVPMFYFKETMAWPRIETGIPLAATAFLLTAFHLFGASILPRAANNGPLLLLGRASYSIYLWHWPLLAILVYVNNDFGKYVTDHIIYFALLTAFTAATYMLLEKNRHRTKKSQAYAILALFIIFSWFVSRDRRTSDEIPEGIRTILETGVYPEKCSACGATTPPSQPFVILWGDSHSQVIDNALEKTCANVGLKLVHIVDTLDGNHENLFSLAKQPQFRGLIMASRWQMYAQGYPADEPEEKINRYLRYNGRRAETTEEATEFFLLHLQRTLKGLPNKPILIFQEVPRYPFFPKKEAIIAWAGLKLRPLPTKTLEKHRQDQLLTHGIFTELATKDTRVKLVDFSDILCPNKECYWREGYNILYLDDDHLSASGAEKMRPLFSELLLELKNGS